MLWGQGGGTLPPLPCVGMTKSAPVIHAMCLGGSLPSWASVFPRAPWDCWMVPENSSRPMVLYVCESLRSLFYLL